MPGQLSLKILVGVSLWIAPLLVGCRSREASSSAAPAQLAAPASPGASVPPLGSPVAEPPGPEAGPTHASGGGPYEISEDELRRATFLAGAVLVRPFADGDALAAVYGESGVRFARLQADERFGQYACGGIDEPSARPWLERAARELSLHAPALLRASGTRWVVACRGLQQGALARGAVPNGAAGTLLLDAESFATEDFFRLTFHHELFHMLDHAEGRRLADPEWSGLNAAGAAYGGGGASARQSSSALGSGGEGFVTEYAMSALEEDKAELFRFLALAPSELGALAERDRVVDAKRNLLLRRLARFCAGQPSRLVCGG